MLPNVKFNDYGVPSNTSLRLAMDFAVRAVTHAMQIGFKAAEFRACLELAIENFEKACEENFDYMEGSK